ncbi:MAG: ribonuclease Z [Clostridia bacterium]|nr:ribonuclease Z [Clostridia bacterium]
MIDVCLLGTGGMMPLPGRFLTSLYLRKDGRAVLIDCGEGTQTAIRTAGLRFKCIDGVLITHFHADHVSGLPGLFLTLGNEGREEPLHIYGPAGLQRVVNALRVIVPELPYEIVCHEFEGARPDPFRLSGMSIQPFHADHGMPCFGYRISLSRSGKFDPVRAKQNGVPVKLWSRLQAGECAEGFTPNDVLGPDRRGLSILYSTDTRPVPAMTELGKDADLLILEGMFGEEDKLERALETHHMTMREAAEIACQCGAKSLWLTHFSPATPHPEEFQEAVASVFENTVIGIDGMNTVLRFVEED